MRRPVVALLLAVGTVLTTLAPAGPAVMLAHADDDGLDIASTVVYTLVPEQRLVRVVADATFTNTLPDSVRNGQITSYYFDSFSWPMPAGARNVVARSGDDTLDIATVDVAGADDYFFIDVSFDGDLRFRETERVTLEYDLVGLPPRSAGYDRINPAYAGFEAYGSGDPGMMDVRFDLPAGWEAEIIGGRYASASANGRVVYRMTSFEDERYGYALFVSARNDGALASTSVTTDEGSAIEILSWPGDDEWTTFITDEISTGLPVLADLLGRPWPEGDDFVIRQAYTPYLYGYAGWYSADDSEIEIGENLDSETVLHELSHAWFNEGWFVDRWVNEGFAQEYSNRTLEERGDEWFDPEDVSPADAGAVTLQEWGDPDFVDGADESEAYGYAASYFVIDAIVDDLDDDAMRALFAAVDSRSFAYVGDLPAETHDDAADWRRLLDLLDEVAGSTSADELFARFVLTPEQAAELPVRATARDLYAELDERGGDWAPPLGVRTAMGEWLWSTADDEIIGAGEVLDARDELDIKARALGIDYPAALETSYESAGSAATLDEVEATVRSHVEGADALLDAVSAEARSDGLLGWIGLIGADLRGDLAGARTAFETGDIDTVKALSTGVVDTVDDASERGNIRLLVAFGAVIVVVAVVASTVRRRRARERRRAEAVMNPGGAALTPTPQYRSPFDAPSAPPPSAPTAWGDRPVSPDQAAASSSSSMGRDDGVAEPPTGSATTGDGAS